eukprot:707469-Amorphochlora_amoeboformis.AAC.1
MEYVWPKTARAFSVEDSPRYSQNDSCPGSLMGKCWPEAPVTKVRFFVRASLLPSSGPASGSGPVASNHCWRVQLPPGPYSASFNPLE